MRSKWAELKDLDRLVEAIKKLLKTVIYFVVKIWLLTLVWGSIIPQVFPGAAIASEITMWQAFLIMTLRILIFGARSKDND